MTFAGLGGVRIPATIVSFSGMQIIATAPSGVAAGPVTVEVGTLASNGVVFSAPALQSITAVATEGTPANAAIASANAGQFITVQGAGFTMQTRLVLPIRLLADNSTGTVAVALTNISPDGTTAQALVPAAVSTFGQIFPNATVVTGIVTIQLAGSGAGTGSAALQIVPDVDFVGFLPLSETPPGKIEIFGRGGNPNGTQVTVGAVPITFPVELFTGNGILPSANLAMRISIPPGGLPAGPVMLATDGGTSSAFLLDGLTAIPSIASQGIPANPSLASANTGQFITVQGLGLANGSVAIFPTTSDTGAPGTVTTTLVNANPAGTAANVFVPSAATTGPVRRGGSVAGGVTLQIVPTIFTFTLPPGATYSPGTVATIQGSGFKEGATTVNFPGAGSVGAGDVLSENSALTVTIPLGATVGLLTVSTDGGTSNALQLRHPVLTAITATATQGTPATPAQASANVNQQMTVTGSELGTSTLVQVPGVDSSGAPTVLPTSGVPSPDGTSLTVSVPPGAITGSVTVKDRLTQLGSGNVPLQVVPTVTAVTGTVTPGNPLTVLGAGFEPTTTLVRFPGSAAPVAADPASISSSSGTQAAVTVPADAASTGPLTVTTTGGTSQAFDLAAAGPSEVEPNDTPATATVMVLDPTTFDVTKAATIDPAGDVDYFRFNADSFGNLYGLELLAGTPPGPDFTVRVTVFDGQLSELASAEGPLQDDGVSVQFETLSDGPHSIKVEALGGVGGPDHTYQIRLFVLAQ